MRDFDYFTYTWVYETINEMPLACLIPNLETQRKAELQDSEFKGSTSKLDNYHLHFSSKL